MRSSSVRFWNTPPESTTTSTPWRSAASAHARAVATASPRGTVRRPLQRMSGVEVRGDGRDRLAGIEHAALARVHQRNRVGRASAIGTTLELDCSLTFVG